MERLKNIARYFKFICLIIKYNFLYIIQGNKSLNTIAGKWLYFTMPRSGGTGYYDVYFASMHKNVIFVRSILYFKDIFFEIEMPFEKIKFLIKPVDLSKIFDKEYEKIIVNSLVFNNHCLQILKSIIGYKKKFPATTIECNIHDYFVVCPRTFLYTEGQYCHAECDNFHCTFFNPPAFNIKGIDIKIWKKSWKAFLITCNAINCFSDSSKDILSKIYGTDIRKKINVDKHSWYTPEYEKVDISNISGVNVGIIGNCSTEMKGLGLIKYMISQSPRSINFILIGTHEKYINIHARNVKYIAKYKRNELRDLVVASKVNIVVFPSIIPETFSFVLTECITMGLPIISLNIGAQGERISAYEKGIVVSSWEEICNVLIKRK